MHGLLWTSFWIFVQAAKFLSTGHKQPKRAFSFILFNNILQFLLKKRKRERFMTAVFGPFFGPYFFWPLFEGSKKGQTSLTKLMSWNTFFGQDSFGTHFYGPHFFWPLFDCSKQAKRSGPKEPGARFWRKKFSRKFSRDFSRDSFQEMLH